VQNSLPHGACGGVLFYRESRRCIALFILTLISPCSAFAEEAPDAPSAAASDATPRGPAQAPPPVGPITPPSMVHYEQTGLPPDVVLSEATSANLELTIGKDGSVTNVRVLTPNHPTLDVEACKAAAKFLFTPAQRTNVDGTTEAVSVVVQFEYWFQPKSPAGETSATPVAAPEATLPAASADGSASAPTTQNTTPANHTEAPAAEPAKSTTSTPVAVEDEVFEGVATVEAPAREPTKRRMESKELVRVAGTRGDPLRAIEVMPGVGQTSGDAPIIRGASGYESAVFLDGSPVPFLYHFGGLTSFIHPRLVDHVELYPGNFSARYGRVTGGVVETGLRKPADKLSGMIDLNLIDSSLLLETPLNENWSVALAGRRSNIDLVFENLVPKDAFDVVAAPTYFDYQGILQYVSGVTEFRIAAFGSKDSLRLIFSQPSSENAELRGSLFGELEFHRVQLLHKTRLGEVKQRVQLGLGLQALSQQFGPNVKAYFDIYEFDTRAEWEIPFGDKLALVTGLDATGQYLTGAYRGPVASSAEGPPDDASSETVVVDEASIALLSPAAYAELRASPTPEWQLMPGLRVDYYHQLHDVSINPRFSQRYALTTSTTLKQGIGLYTQPPIYHEAFAPIGNPDIQPYHSIHTSLGAEHTLVEGLTFDVEGFHKYLFNRVVNTPQGEAPHFVNDGEGRIYGVESGATYHSGSGLSGQLSYTLSRSERRDRDEDWRLFDQDQTHILNVAGAYDIGAGWELSSRFRYVTGNPVTPVEGSVYDTNRALYLPLYGALNSDRDPAFHQLDVRVQKTFTIGSGYIAAYLDVQNVYNSANPRGYTYSYDYQTKEAAPGSFFFPNLGIRGKL
jgi:TonB family protein